MSTFSGNSSHMPGAFRIERRFDTVDAGAGWTETDFRTGDWFPAADLLTAEQRTQAALVGEIKQITVISRAAGEIDMADASPPGLGQFYRAESGKEVVGFTANYSNQMGRSSVWFRTGSGATSWSVEVFFDIPVSV